MIRLSGAVKSSLREDVRELLPLSRLGAELLERIRFRVHAEGLAGDGAPWSPYSTRRNRKGERGKRFYWTPVGAPQPAEGRIVVAKTGRFAGRAAYGSVGDYLKSAGYPRNGPKSFVMTGELRDSMELFIRSQAHATIQYGSRRRQSPFYRAKSGAAYTNAKVAHFAFRMERMGPMVLSREELASVDEFLAREVPPQLIKEMSASALEQRASKVLKRANKFLQGGV